MSNTWPISSDFSDAVQMPDVCCSDPDLQAAEVAMLENGLPRPPCAGNFADVYQFRSRDGQRQWAVKCFTRPMARLKERYREISLQLEAARLPFTVGFQYLEQGMRIRGEWYPVVKMDWVEGLTLRQFVEQNLQKPRMLNLLFQIWLKVEPLLRKAEVAHGDLQHGNVMLVPGSSEGKLALKLIDYDGMWVPSLAGQPPGEVGHPCFQHPQRAKRNVYSPEIDRFPHLVIACALRGLARQGGERLWKDYDNGDNLLFTKPDFVSPTQSKLLRELWNSGDSELHSWVGHLVSASQSPLEAVPLLSTLVNDGRIRPLSDAEEKSVSSILGSATQVARTDLKSGAESDWWNAEVAESLTEEAAAEPIEDVGRRTVVRPDKKDAYRFKSGAKRTKQKTKGESRHEGTVPLWMWGTVCVLTFFLGSSLVYWLSTRLPEQVLTVEAIPSPASSQGSLSMPTEPKQTESPKPASDPDWDPANVRELVTLTGHTDHVTSVAFSTDGKRMASGSGEYRNGQSGKPGEVKVWDTTSGQEMLTLKGHTDRVNSVAFSPDGMRLASASDDNTVKVWDVTSGQETLTLKGYIHMVTSVVFSPDGKWLASSGGNNTVKVWDATSGQELLTLKGHNSIVTSVVFSADGKRLATASYDQTVKVWDAANGQEMLTLKGHTGVVNSVAFSSDGKRLASASDDQTVREWDATNGQETLTLKGLGGGARSVAFSPDGKRLASAVYRTVRVWDATSGEETLTLNGHTNHVMSVAFSADGKRLASASFDKTLKVWDVGKGKTDFSESSSVPKLTESLKPAPDVTAPANDGEMFLDPKLTEGSKLAPDSDWDPENVRELATLTGHTDPVTSVAFSANGTRLATASWDRRVKVWDATNGQETLTFKVRTREVQSLAFSADGKRLASGSGDGAVKVWDATNGQETLTLKGHTSLVKSLAFSPDGKRLASAGNIGDQTVKVWDTTSGLETLTLKGHTGYVTSVAFNPDGTRLASGSADATVRVWDTTSGQEMLTLKGKPGSVHSVVFSEDGKRLASASFDLTVWDATSGQETLTLKGLNGVYTSMAFSADGKRLASGSRDGAVKIWRADRVATDSKVSTSAAANVLQPATTNPTTPSDNSVGTAPPLASAPFGVAQAKQNQAAWAKHLSSPVTFDNSIGMALACIPAGEFDMGSPDSEKGADRGEKPQHRVRITRPFYMGKYEVTQGEYEEVMKEESPGYFSPNGDGKGIVKGMDTRRFPVETVSWGEAQEFCRRLSELPEEKTAGRTYRLPTEAEWEYACRAGTTTPFHFGSVNNGRKANINGIESTTRTAWGPNLGRTTTVGSYPANAWGLCDLHGNVSEWCQDGYERSSYLKFQSQMAVDPTGPSAGGSARVLRGGSWYDVGGFTRAAHRSGYTTLGNRKNDFGFRVVCAFATGTDSSATGKLQPPKVGAKNANSPRTAPPKPNF